MVMNVMLTMTVMMMITIKVMLMMMMMMMMVMTTIMLIAFAAAAAAVVPNVCNDSTGTQKSTVDRQNDDDIDLAGTAMVPTVLGHQRYENIEQ